MLGEGGTLVTEVDWAKVGVPPGGDGNAASRPSGSRGDGRLFRRSRRGGAGVVGSGGSPNGGLSIACACPIGPVIGEEGTVPPAAFMAIV